VVPYSFTLFGIKIRNSIKAQNYQKGKKALNGKWEKYGG
jgi:hypothetical protein